MTSPSPEISKMKAGEIRQELESYGISTKSFFEKSELVEALEKARSEGKKPSPPPSSRSKESTNERDTTSTKSSTKASSSTRESRYQEAFAKAQAMKVAELRSALQEMGVSTKSFFEKSEFVKAYADAVADGKTASGTGSRREEPYDPSYRDVVMQKFNGRDPRLLEGGKVIDVKAISTFS
jgi:hypothetical protein